VYIEGHQKSRQVKEVVFLIPKCPAEGESWQIFKTEEQQFGGT